MAPERESREYHFERRFRYFEHRFRYFERIFHYFERIFHYFEHRFRYFERRFRYFERPVVGTQLRGAGPWRPRMTLGIEVLGPGGPELD